MKYNKLNEDKSIELTSNNNEAEEVYSVFDTNQTGMQHVTDCPIIEVQSCVTKLEQDEN